ncbi:hypothetical protein B0H14DRAFT_2351493, partial [Mycena olivaceomarginata]
MSPSKSKHGNPLGLSWLTDTKIKCRNCIAQTAIPVQRQKTAFWKAYKTLVDEFDEDFQRKYGNDLDSALIFAGLFSAVSSAFIIQIQPDLLPNPNATTQELLGILVQNMTGTAVPDSMADTPPPVITVVAQSLLYISLFMTLMAALLAVLGKQW